MGMKIKVLVVDDDRDHREMVRAMLELKGFAVTECKDAPAALVAAAKSRPDIILSDVAMPKLSGLALCRKLKKDPRTRGVPVVLMSGARRDEREQAAGIELGADDYLIKPFTPRLLLAKLSAVLRRFAAPSDLQDTLEAEGLKLNVETRETSLRGRDVALTRKEFDLLLALLRRRGRVVSVPALLESVWGYDSNDYSDPHTVETHVSSLRRKLGARLAKRIETIPTRGYRFAKA